MDAFPASALEASLFQQVANQQLLIVELERTLRSVLTALPMSTSTIDEVIAGVRKIARSKGAA